MEKEALLGRLAENGLFWHFLPTATSATFGDEKDITGTKVRNHHAQDLMH